MSEDRRVKGRSDEEVRRHSKRTKLDYRVDRVRPANILRVLRSGSVLTLYGRKKLVLKVVDDEVLGRIDAKTEPYKDKITITCKRSVERDARGGNPRYVCIQRFPRLQRMLHLFCCLFANEFLAKQSRQTGD
jgi:hypothetical protein